MHPNKRLLPGPGTSSVPQRVLRALGAPTLAHMDPQYLQIMDYGCARLREVFRTVNPLTIPVSEKWMAGHAWRIGLMSHGATVRSVDLVLTALGAILRR
jgi:alanine-glyoxylate transaminase/serine-glyoxylate transaminase/serine-pyruvate transaminase